MKFPAPREASVSPAARRWAAALALLLAPLPLHAKAPAPKPPAVAPAGGLDSLNAEQIRQALSILQERHVSAKSLDADGLARATLRGLLDELRPGAELAGGETAKPGSSPFRAETLAGDVGYIRLGSLQPATITEIKGTLKDFTAHHVDALVLDLRATPESGDYSLAAAAAGSFVPKGTPLFSLTDAEGRAVKSFTADGPRLFDGVVVVIADGSTAGAAEALAAVLRRQTQAMLVGTTTSGRAVEFSTAPLGEGRDLRFAIAEVRVDGLPPIYPRGLAPDLEVAQNAAVRGEVLEEGLEAGPAPFVFERERARRNEAALAAGTDPEMDAPEESPALVDRPLQRAVDLIIAIRFFRQKDPPISP